MLPLSTKFLLALIYFPKHPLSLPTVQIGGGGDIVQLPREDI